ncbi:MAG TPA: amino acid--tRNA ligase-related protein, partial [Gammaproteobacteria bacterium]|nr:amino acid--tRNA ligase-related protein [Gammaproteobacteria bacterium]
TDADEQQRRFRTDLTKRQQLNLPAVAMDRRLLAALAHGLPDCAGVALGIDRLIMLAANVKHIADVLAFSWGRA